MPRPHRHAFTLLEMMLVIVIIGLLAGVAVVALTGQGDTARIGATKASMNNIKTALSSYQIQHGAFPPALPVLVPGFLEKVVKDAWNEDFLYYTPSADPTKGYDLVSKGKDKVAGTPDDLNVWALDQD